MSWSPETQSFLKHSPPPAASPPARGSSQSPAPKSQFTHRHLLQLAAFYASCPLRVVAHMDIDCFYAQAEMIKRGITPEKPFAVQQWQGLIAVNYAARAFGISRHTTATEAKKLCPALQCQHVATWKEGDDKWAYHDDAAANMATHKVSLDPYRKESRSLVALVKENLPPHLQRVEKASIDEVFLDLSAHVHAVLMQRFPELSGPPPSDDPDERLPMPSVLGLHWQDDLLVGIDDGETTAELEDPDWDDVAMNIGSEIMRGLRTEVRRRLGYTSSAGVASNKMLSKLGSAHKKPNSQTIIRRRAAQNFLSGFKLTKIRNLGGKLGEQVCMAFMTDMVVELLKVPIEQCRHRFGDDTGTWIYNVIRGVDHNEVNPRTQINSILSAKSFRPAINTTDQAIKWLRIFVADVHSRLVEEGILENRRRPRTISLQHRHGSQARSRQSAIPQGGPLDHETLLDLATNLLGQLSLEGGVWPCSNLSLTVSGFEEGVRNNTAIDSFFPKGGHVLPMAPPVALLKPGTSRAAEEDSTGPAPKRPRRPDGIERFFPPKGVQKTKGGQSMLGRPSGKQPGQQQRGLSDAYVRDEYMSDEPASRAPANHQQTPVAPGYTCDQCDAGFETGTELQCHQDWHFAKELQDQEGRVRPRVARNAAPTTHAPDNTSNSQHGAGASSSSSSSRRPGRPKKTEPGQGRLNFEPFE
ncbi:hypothetical protein QBC46DRAFT_252917 [Diplogelasinospora grovesii]|uniref:DNA polymerase eta n=1 Tax=Diplogelasinospora grovesii TaxID=303347 RepID=A0AAN6S8S6_9PEZI|nr:hypothetical protein QBC46DRAFT_252917 [Diplogelasinospora grovesii]